MSIKTTANIHIAEQGKKKYITNIIGAYNIPVGNKPKRSQNQKNHMQPQIYPFTDKT
ncbi:hypothetical protein HanHA300_Chr04g0118741 [Helianthus annuus]|nr:hypothetical protein HanHA300_Chr04g0118741 [Helianthus annuus]KAJ0586737.1 hypothetical protein HanIR_Chr04g0155151 [Helianthus annuus]KAJ0595411.1 hypothetical protein HanHA89_Chr04g0131071 [Helianthus annuus]KAJ0756087.1 hypothetical protein HanLR1_Chr04g0123081 [Helianthus annuus]